MPELPEVQTVVDTLQPLVGRRLGTGRVRLAKVLRGEKTSFNRFAKGKKIHSITRQAKRIVFNLEGGRRLLFHLGMTGQLFVQKRTDPVLPHTHLRVLLSGLREELRFRDVRRFGGVWLLKSDTPPESCGLGPVGPDALEISLRDFRGLLTRHRQIKALLLDQTVLAGLGNIYADESLFKAGIHPQTRAVEISPQQVKRLHQAMHRILQAAIKAGGSTISDYRTPNGEKGWFQIKHQAYGREGKPCQRCHAPIIRIQAGGRSSHICPECQQI